MGNTFGPNEHKHARSNGFSAVEEDEEVWYCQQKHIGKCDENDRQRDFGQMRLIGHFSGGWSHSDAVDLNTHVNDPTSTRIKTHLVNDRHVDEGANNSCGTSLDEHRRKEALWQPTARYRT